MRGGMRLAAAGAIAAAAVSLAACSNDTQQVSDSNWQITDVYTTPGTPSAVDDSVAGAVTLNFGDKTVSGYTGCAPLNGIVKFTGGDGDQLAAPEDATKVEFTQVKFKPIEDDQCQGKVRYMHDALVNMLVDGSFTIRHEGDGVMVLTEQSDAVDPRAIRLIVG